MPVRAYVKTFEECELSLNVDAQLRAKDLCIEFSPQRLRMAVKGQRELEGIHVAESMWSLERDSGKASKTLTIVLSKVKARAKHEDKVQQNKGQPLQTPSLTYKDCLESEAEEAQSAVCCVSVCVDNLFNSMCLEVNLIRDPMSVRLIMFLISPLHEW